MKKVILVAFSIDPRYGTEDGYANTWLEIISKHYFVEVFTDAINREGVYSKKYVNCKFHFIEGLKPWRKFGKKTGLVNVGTRIFFRKVKKELEKWDLHDFELIHCITPAGIHSHNDLYELCVPIIVGPLGGGLITPSGFKNAFRGQYTKTLLRDLFYWWKLKWSRGLRKYLSNADRIVLGISLRQDLLPEKARHKCISIPDAFVDVNCFTPKSGKNENDLVRILFAGRFISNKGPLLLLDAAKRCLENGVSGFVVEFAGFGQLKEYMEKQIQKQNLENNVKIIGDLVKEELVRKYQDSDIFCLPTLREPGGIAILEAMACGLPVITSNYGGPAISVTKDCGIKIDLNNYASYVEELADAIMFFIKNPEVRNRMGTMGRLRAEREYSVEALSKKVIDLYEGIINK